MNRKILVLGSNAFSGQDFIDLLLEDTQREVIGVSRSPEPLGIFLKYKTREDLSRYRFFQIDMNRNMPALLDLLARERPEAIVNFAAQSEVAPSWEHPEHWFQTNCVGLAQLVNHLRGEKYLRRYVHISSPEVYGACTGRVIEDAPLNPSTPYAASKAAADLLLSTYLKQFNFPLLTVRATNVYGARQQLFKIIPRSVIYLKLGRKIELHGGGAAVKSYIHIRDVSRGELAVLERGRIGRMYHLSPNGCVSVREVVEAICKLMGCPFKENAVAVEERPGQDAAYVIDSGRARSELGWSPTIALSQGLADVTQWVEKYWDEISKGPLQYVHKA